MKKSLISQLNQLKEIKPDSAWKESGQELLRSQIFTSKKKQIGIFNLSALWLRDFVKVSSQPAFALAAFVLILVTSVFFSQPLLSDAKPNDSLYIARIISEKTHLNMVFDRQERDNLSAKFATGHAKDITHILTDPNFNNQENREQVDKLNENFKKEIYSAKQSLASPEQAEELNTEEELIFSAETSKEQAGLEIQENDAVTIPEEDEEIMNEEIVIEEETASSSDLMEVDTVKMLEEAEKLFNDQKYIEAIDKLNEVDLILKVQGGPDEDLTE